MAYCVSMYKSANDLNLPVCLNRAVLPSHSVARRRARVDLSIDPFISFLSSFLPVGGARFV